LEGFVLVDDRCLLVGGRHGKEEFLKWKKDQFEAYWAEKQNNVRFNE
jgi:hypothetical protein